MEQSNLGEQQRNQHQRNNGGNNGSQIVRYQLRPRRQQQHENTFQWDYYRNNFFYDLPQFYNGRRIARRQVRQYRRRSGLAPKRIKRFEHFRADDTLVGERCLVCMKDLKNGTRMVRLDCHTDHILCLTCTNKWFKDNKTCPKCRHGFI